MVYPDRMRSTDDSDRLSSQVDVLEEIFRCSPTGLCVVDRELRCLRANDACAQVFARPVADLIGRSIRAIIPGAAWADAVAETRRVLQTGEPVLDFELRRRAPGNPGPVASWSVNIHPVEREGDVAGALIILRDVTAVRRAEAIAARRLRELEALYANAPVGLCHMDTTLRIVNLNPLFAQLSERPPEQQVGATAREVLPASIARQVVPQLEYVARSGVSSPHVEVSGRTPTTGSSEFTWNLHIHPVTSEDGEVTGIILVLQDVTVLADQQRKIAAVSDRLAQAQSVARLGSWEWDIIGDTVWWSEELYEIFGETRSQTPSYDRFFDRVHPDERQNVRRQLDRTLTEGDPYRITFRIIRPDGSERVIFAAAQLERTDGGGASKLMGTCQDVTEPSARPRVPRRRAKPSQGGSLS
jgi:PAS domain S-box-containing protein